MRLDSHQHFWSYDEKQYPWIAKGSPLERDWLPADLAKIQERLGIDGSIAVQARQTLEESRWLLRLAEQSPRIKGVVGWVNLRHQSVELQLAELAKHPKFVGVRHVVQDEHNDRFMLETEFVRGIGKLGEFGLTYDILIVPGQLAAAIELTQRFPSQPFVIDHIAKPEIKSGRMSPWDEQIRELAKSPNVHCKISGMITEADHGNWKPDDLKPYLDAVFEAFGVQRLMFGSDWPVCLLAGSYEQVFELTDTYTNRLPAASREAIFGGNAAQFYLW